MSTNYAKQTKEFTSNKTDNVESTTLHNCFTVSIPIKYKCKHSRRHNQRSLFKIAHISVDIVILDEAKHKIGPLLDKECFDYFLASICRAKANSKRRHGSICICRFIQLFSIFFMYFMYHISTALSVTS